MALLYKGDVTYPLTRVLTRKEIEWRAPALFCEGCNTVFEAESNDDAEQAANFVSEHQHHGSVWLCYKNDEGDWTGYDTIKRLDS